MKCLDAGGDFGHCRPASNRYTLAPQIRKTKSRLAQMKIVLTAQMNHVLPNKSESHRNKPLTCCQANLVVLPDKKSRVLKQRLTCCQTITPVFFESFRRLAILEPKEINEPKEVLGTSSFM